MKRDETPVWLILLLIIGMIVALAVVEVYLPDSLLYPRRSTRAFRTLLILNAGICVLISVIYKLVRFKSVDYKEILWTFLALLSAGIFMYWEKDAFSIIFSEIVESFKSLK